MDLIEILKPKNDNKIFICTDNGFKVRTDTGKLLFLYKTYDDKTQNWMDCTVSDIWANAEYQIYEEKR